MANATIQILQTEDGRWSQFTQQAVDAAQAEGRTLGVMDSLNKTSYPNEDAAARALQRRLEGAASGFLRPGQDR